MFSSSAFDYINVLDKAADASWLRNSTLVNKRYDVDFQSLLEMELMESKYNRDLDSRVHNVHMNHLTAISKIDQSSDMFSYREDGNNVDIHLENVELASERLRYQGLTDSISQEFMRMRTALGK